MINSLKIRGVLVVFCLLSFADGIAQNFSQHNWYFGNSPRGIRFSRTNNTATVVNNQATPFGTGGSSVGTDPTNANLLFYTDGARVFDVTHAQMPNGFGLNALTSANQPVAISQIPGAPFQYYIFTNNASFTTGGTISVTTVDMSASGNDVFPEPRIGNVTTKNVPIGLAGRSEGMITIPHANGTDFWLLTHQNGTDNYTVTLIGPSGTFTHTTLPNVTGLPISVANFSFHESTGKIAVSPQTADRNVVILNFDNSTGALTLDQFVFNSASSTTTQQSIYDTEWSNSGRFLYISRHGEAGIPADVFQFDLNNPGTSLAPVLGLAVNRSYGLQMAPDSAIYHLYQATAGGPFLVGKLTNTDTLAVGVVNTPNAFPGGLNFSGTQFPSFSPKATINLTVTFVAAGTCSASPVSFYPLVIPAADSLSWDFGDGQTSNQWSPIYTYQNGGAYDVKVTAFLNGDTATSTQTINLTQFDLQLTLVQDTTACKCELPVNNGIPPCPNDKSDDFSVTVKTQGGNPTSFTWSNGDTGPKLTPDSAGYYYVVVADASGCSAYAGVNVREYDATDQRANIWYFGQNAGINFNNPPGVTAISGPVNTPEGVSVISDRNGQVIFSTDGVHVYDRNDVEIPLAIPPGIGGEQGSTQAALIIPVPGDETLYYIFTTQEVHGSNTYELRYSLYDIKMNNGDGGLSEINQLLFSRSTERITGAGNWLIAHEYGNNSFRAYPITATGIGNPVISDIGSDHMVTDEYNGRGYMKLGAQNQLVVALPSFNVSNVLEFFDFDNTTGLLTNFRSVNLNSSAQQVYGVEFVGNKIFATLSGTPSFLREIYIDFQGNPVLIPPGGASGPFTEELGAIQLGPDGQVYVAVNNRPALGTIQVNADTLQLSTFSVSGFPLAGGTMSQLGLPNFIQNVGQGPQLATMQVTGLCFGDSTNFAGTGTDQIDKFEWSFGDGFSANTQDAKHLYAAAGNYVVTLRVTNRCGLDTLLTQNITIVPPPPNPNFLPLGQQPVLCTGSITLEAEPAPGTPGTTYLWSTTETTRTIVVSQQSRIDVTVTNSAGCTSNGTIIVADNRPQVDLGPDQTICQNDPIAPLDAQNPGTTHQWFFNEVANGNTAQTQSVNTAAFGIFEYKVQVNDPITLCSVKDSVVFTINESPNFTAIPTNTTACGVNNGQIALTINSPAATLFSYLVVGAATGTTLQGIDRTIGPVLPPFTGLGADTYVVQLTDQISSCATTTTVGISNTTVVITSAVAQTPTCNPKAINVTTTGITNFTGANYVITDSGTGAQVTSGPVPAANFSTSPIPIPGSYTIQVNAVVQGCIATFNFNTVSHPITPVTFSPNLCSAQITALPAGAVLYDWSTSQAGAISGATNSQTVSLNAGTWNLTVIVNDGTNCPGTGTTTVTVEPTPVANFTQSDACENTVTLTATPIGSYTYRWYDNGVLLVGGSSIVIGTSENGATYGVEVVSTLTGCVSPRFSQQVFVAGDLQLTMTTTTPCIGIDFTLTGTSNIAGTNFQWGVNGNDIAGATQPTLVRNSGGLYRLTGTLPGCTETIRELVILFPQTAGSLPARALICPDIANPNPETREVRLDAGPNFVSYNWLQGGVPIGVTTQTYTATEEGIFGVELVNSYGCPSTDQTDVIEECNPRIVAPTAFRPGSTIGANSTFYVFTYFVANEDFQIFLYNRWGELVYQSSGLDAEGDQSKHWNGGYNNNASQLLPAGTYSYVVRYRSSYRPQDGIQEKRGGVVLLR